MDIDRRLDLIEARLNRMLDPAPPPAPVETVVRAKVTTAIPTGTFASPSSAGRAQIYHKDADGNWSESGDPVKVWNDNVLTVSLPVGRTIKLAWIDDGWWLLSASCS